ncbi:MAG: family acetyltransferase [Chloroflexi bacterium]|nr:family acetyltransferase [Chloroflexota bacterium]
MKWSRAPYVISTDTQRIDVDAVHAFLTTAYWSVGVARDVVQRAIEHSLNFGLFHEERQIGFARVLTDYTKLAYLSDVYVLSEYRGQGLGRWLVQVVFGHPELQDLHWMLCTSDAQGLYRPEGFTPLSRSEMYMEKGPRRPVNP